jgi:hypothetical protein
MWRIARFYHTLSWFKKICVNLREMVGPAIYAKLWYLLILVDERSDM